MTLCWLAAGGLMLAVGGCGAPSGLAANPVPLAQAQMPADLTHAMAQTDKPLLLSFYEPGCPWCQRLAPILENFNGEYGSRVRFLDVDCQQHPECSSQFHIERLPTVILYVGGRQLGPAIVGLHSEQIYRDALNQAVAAQRSAPAATR